MMNAIRKEKWWSEILRLGLAVSDVFYGDTCLTEKVNAVGQAVASCIDHSFDTSLNDKLGTLYARSIGDIECCSIRVVA